MNDNKNELENLKREAREFKDSLLHVLWVLFFLFIVGVTLWQIWELIKVFVIKNIGEATQTTFGIIFWVVVALIAIAIKKDWWDKRQEKKMREEISADLHQKKEDDEPLKEKYQEFQVGFFRKNPKYPKPKNNKRLTTLISTKGKSPEEAAREAFQNFQKYEQVEAQIIFRGKNPNNPKNNGNT